MSIYPIGCRVVFKESNHNNAKIIEDFPAARHHTFVDNLFRLHDQDHKEIALFNFDHILFIVPITTVGPAGVPDAGN